MSVPITLIQQFPFFDGLSQSELDSLASLSQLASVKANQEILSAGSLIQYLSFVVTGELQKNELANEGRVVSLTILGPGHTLGLLALADEKPITYSVRTISPCNLLVIPIAHARNLSFSNPMIQKRVFAMLAALVRRANEERAMLSIPNAFQRVFAQLQLLTQATNQDSAVQAIPKQQDIANMVNTSRETVSRALQTLIKLGILSKTGHQIHIQQSGLLERLAKEGPNALQSDTSLTDRPQT